MPRSISQREALIEMEPKETCVKDVEANDAVPSSDQEPALQDLLVFHWKEQIHAKTFYELSPVGSSASNVVDRGVQTVEGQNRVLKNAVEARVSVAVASHCNILAWLVHFMGREGGGRGKASRLLELDFVDLVNFRPPACNSFAKLESFGSHVVFLGNKTESVDVMLACSGQGSYSWHKKILDFICGVPWKARLFKGVAANIRLWDGNAGG